MDGSAACGVIGLPGNPVSSYVCAYLFLVPLIRRLSGRSSIHHVRESALLGRDLAANDQREDYLRARIETRDDGALIATPVNHQDSSLLGNLAAARALLIRPPFAPGSDRRLALRRAVAAAVNARHETVLRNLILFTRN